MEKDHLKLTVSLGYADVTKVGAFSKALNNAVEVYNRALDTAFVDLQNSLKAGELPASLIDKISESLLKNKVEQEITILNCGTTATILDARRILGRDFIEPSDVEAIFSSEHVFVPKQFHDGFELPFTVEFLERMRDSPEGCVLVYQPTVSDGKIIDLWKFAEMQKHLKAKPDNVDLLDKEHFLENGKLGRWLSNKDYLPELRKHTIKPGWRLSTKTIIPGTEEVLISDQIKAVCNWIHDLHEDCIQSVKLRNVVSEFRSKDKIFEIITELYDLPSEMGEKIERFIVAELEKTLFWQNCMETGVETLYRMIVHNQKTEEKILFNSYTQNNVASKKLTHYAGYFEDGAGLGSTSSNSTDEYVGLVFSITEEF